MERLDQGYLHPKLERGPETDMPRPGIKPGLPGALLQRAI
jgi:hypothetical protein